jgi:DNA polymerase-3 subunit alpha
MHRIHSWASDGEGLPCIVEDDDGIRILQIEGASIARPHYREAIDAGAQAILSFPHTPDSVPFLLVEDFAELREERGNEFYVAPKHWSSTPGPISGYISLASRAPATDTSRSYVNLHTHSEFSSLDGLALMGENAARAAGDGQPALAVTDHGTCAGHVELQKACDAAGIKPIFGLEAYLVDDRFSRDGKPHDYWHLSLWALDDEGLSNLWAMSTESERDGKYGKYPRLDWDTLRRHSRGVAAATGCLGGPIAQPLMGGDAEDFDEGDPEAARANLAKLRDIFGDDLYGELHTGDTPIQRHVNDWVVRESGRLGMRVLAVSDSHYACPEDKLAHRTWFSVQIHQEVGDEGSMFTHDTDLHVHTADEARAALAYLGPQVAAQAVAETVRFAERCTARIEPRPSTPIFSRATRKMIERAEAEGRPVDELRRERDIERLVDLLESNWGKFRGRSKRLRAYQERMDHELPMYIRKGFTGYVLILAEVIAYAREHNVAVGAGRGSGGGSLVLYGAGITDIDPVEHDLLFERFMTEGRVALPDVDVDFPSSHKQFMLDFVRDRWGADHVVTVGTHLRLRNKGAINNTAQAMRESLPEDYFLDLQKVSKLVDAAEASSAGLGIPWDDLWAQHGEELEEYADRYPELFEMAGKLHGRLKSYGRHAAGVVIDTDHSIEDALPLRAGEVLEDGTPGPMITQFDMDALEWLGYVKFDFLNLRTLDTMQHAVDLVVRDTGRRVDFREWREEYADPEIFEAISDGWTKGIFQIETTSGTRMAKRFRPETMAELADVITLVRPGPMNSGLTEEYLRRRAGESEVTFQDPRLKEVLAKTYGLMIYQEDIMAVCMVLGGYDSNEADAVRKILGKKKIELVAAEGRKFVSRCTANGVEREVAESMWDDMAEFAKYSFNRAHAFAYAVIGFQTAWMKVHYPVQMMAALLSTVDQDRIGEFVEEARRLGIAVAPPDINLSGLGFSSTAREVRYGLDAIHGVGEKAVQAVVATAPYTSYQDFIERRSTKCNMGAVKLLVRVGAFDSLEPNRRGLLAYIEAEEQPGTARCRWLDPSDPQGIGLPCGFDWASEPAPLGRPNRLGERKALKRKPLPKKCTRACRQFSPLPPPDPSSIEAFTDGDIGQIEQELLGVRLSTSEFDRIPEDIRDELSTATEVAMGPFGDYVVAALIQSSRVKKDRYDREFAWLSLSTENGPIESIIVFADKYEKYSKALSFPGLVFAIVKKTDRGLQLVEISPAY